MPSYADVVLPATTMFEIDSYMVYGPIFRLREKLIDPVGEARNDYLIMAELARRLGYGEQYPQTEDALLRFVLEGSGFTLEDVRAAGGSVRIPAPLMEYRKWTKGKLRTDGRPGFETPTGKFELRSDGPGGIRLRAAPQVRRAAREPVVEAGPRGPLPTGLQLGRAPTHRLPLAGSRRPGSPA